MLTLRQMRRHDRNTIEKPSLTVITLSEPKRPTLHSLTSEGLNVTLRIQIGKYLFKFGRGTMAITCLLSVFQLGGSGKTSRLSDGTAHRSSLARKQNISRERGRASPPCLAQGSSTSSR